MSLAIRKWRAIFVIFFQEGLAYRASGLIWVMTDLATAVTMPLVWASAGGGAVIAGFTRSDFVLYYLCLLALQSFIFSHMMWEIAMEIKEGLFNAQLIRPVSFFQYTILRNLAWRIIRTCIFFPIFLVLLFLYRAYLVDAHIFVGWQFWASLLLGHLVSFTFVFAMALIALFVQETEAIFQFYYFPALFLSGQIFPIAVLPQWAQKIGHMLPFYYTTGAPTEILVGRTSPDAATGIIITQAGWVVGLYLLQKVFWKYGLRGYNGVGL